MQIRLASLLAVVVLMLALAAPAVAQTSSQDGYNDTAGLVQTQTGGGGGGSSLPFTGLDALLIAGAGALLVGAGLGMRRLTRAHDGSPA